MDEYVVIYCANTQAAEIKAYGKQTVNKGASIYQVIKSHSANASKHLSGEVRTSDEKTFASAVDVFNERAINNDYEPALELNSAYLSSDGSSTIVKDVIYSTTDYETNGDYEPEIEKNIAYYATQNENDDCEYSYTTTKHVEIKCTTNHEKESADEPFYI